MKLLRTFLPPRALIILQALLTPLRKKWIKIMADLRSDATGLLTTCAPYPTRKIGRVFEVSVWLNGNPDKATRRRLNAVTSLTRLLLRQRRLRKLCGDTGA